MAPSQLIYIYILSLLPTIEGRYAFLAGVAGGRDALGPLAASLAGVATLAVTLPAALPLLDSLARRLSGSRYRLLARAARLYLWYLGRLRERASAYVERYGLLGLTVFVAAPIPGTGQWSGALLAYMLGLRRGATMGALALGGLLSIAITSLAYYGVGLF